MARNLLVVISIITQRVVLRKRILPHQFTGLVGTLASIGISYGCNIAAPERYPPGQQPSAWTGLLYASLGGILASTHILVEEYLYVQKFMPFTIAVGIEGMAAVYTLLSVMPAFQESGAENLLGWVNEEGYKQRPFLIYCLSVTALAVSGVYLAETESSGRARSVTFLLRAPLVCLGEHLFLDQQKSAILWIGPGLFAVSFIVLTMMWPLTTISSTKLGKFLLAGQ